MKNKIIYPKVVDFGVNSECHYNCRYCFGPKLIKSLSFEKIKDIVYKFKNLNCQLMAITGGEPLLRNDIAQILELINSLNIKISISTTGKLFFKYVDTINKCVQHIGLPVDWDSEEFTYKENGALQDVLNILEYYKNRPNRPIIKIGTVCTKENLHKLNDIGKLLAKYNKSIDIWKIYQFIPRGKNAVINRKDLEITSQEFLKGVDGIESKFSSYFSIVISPRELRASAYFLVNPNGDVFTPLDNGVNCKEEVIGNLISDNWDKILSKWSNIISVDNYMENIKKTFRISS